ncbi:hypothetical protein AMR42_10805 [Limnothrix sp. PR1529]|uniref:PEP-CTERM sorting domain-containing protein n=1 Tax=Limnothrix sp. PR1529 TaxID=1704291 RepID=UPI00081E3482|nr:PEP-CTERM sorting domain-containing protein [Limnothrix sp. PR1529]OCQ93136.1 hypothetical protein BCR12_12480 [Limnothrix sp. P13C2]PIB10108.1 hypothetical protein AMR42_10805 [Limnothrix sp. PR1529]
MKRFQQIASTLALALVPALIATQPAQAANLVKNGSFEVTPGAPLNGGWRTFSEIEGWSATKGGKIEVQAGVAGKAYDGKNLVELDSHFYDSKASELGLFQDIVTKAGKTYELSFVYSARPGIANNWKGGKDQNAFSVLFGSSFNQVFNAGNGGSQTNWLNSGPLLVKAVSDLTRLQFNYLGTRDTYGAYIDNVSLTEVASTPEPVSLLGLLAVGTAVGVAAKKRQHAID